MARSTRAPEPPPNATPTSHREQLGGVRRSSKTRPRHRTGDLPLTWPNVVTSTTTSGPDGTAFKPSPDRRIPCGTRVAAVEVPSSGRRRHARSDPEGLVGRGPGRRGTAFKPGAAPAVQGDRRRPRTGLHRRVVHRLAGGPSRRTPDHDHRPPGPPRHRAPQVTSGASRPPIFSPAPSSASVSVSTSPSSTTPSATGSVSSVPSHSSRPSGSVPVAAQSGAGMVVASSGGGDPSSSRAVETPTKASDTAPTARTGMSAQGMRIPSNCRRER
jgi:hypothetical protein